jgi:hypothetical protein
LADDEGSLQLVDFRTAEILLRQLTDQNDSLEAFFRTPFSPGQVLSTDN